LDRSHVPLLGKGNQCTKRSAMLSVAHTAGVCVTGLPRTAV